MALDISLIFRAVNIIAAVFIIVGGVSTIIKGGTYRRVCVCLRLVPFWVSFALTVLFEFKLPSQITRYASFMFGFGGRAIFYIFIGGITLNYGPLSIACGVIVLLIGVVYLVLEFVPGIQTPTNMQMEAFEQSLGYNSVRTTAPMPPQQHAGIPHEYDSAHASEAAASPYPTKTYVSDGAVV
ncbi:predicted protein [Lichtheimia corymbifera JMRC:FSU:9682]|uniref:COPI associated n=1 Tax=Lichtheimia corymbifera JMRC:FSU:9682 TaxID=1263082 RepID=A0A068RQT8_9FUNG|nr:predicted protein [Lichtheimia corymbifera JMRC:FSU:9682]